MVKKSSFCDSIIDMVIIYLGGKFTLTKMIHFKEEMEFKTSQVDISFSTTELIKAAKNDWTLYCPVGINGEILHQEAYWASEPRNSQDLDLECCTYGAFAFDENDKDCLNQSNHYATLDLPATASEYLSMKSIEEFDYQVSVLMRNGCDLAEAHAIATSHATGLPVIRAK